VKQIVVLEDTSGTAEGGGGAGSPVLATIAAPSGTAGGVRIDPKDYSTSRSSRWVVVLGPRAAGVENFLDAYGGTEAVRYSVLPSANDLPDNVLGLDGVDVVLWEADWIKPSDVAPDFQLKAILDWVESGGHLIITAGRQAEELQRAGRLRDALPMTLTGTREIDMRDLRALPLIGAEFGGRTGTVGQLVGTIRQPMAKPLAGTGGGGNTENGIFADHPLVATGVYGRGAITLLTVDAASPEIVQGLRNEKGITFWSQVAGWQPGDVLTKAHFADRAAAEEQPGFTGEKLKVEQPNELKMGKGIATLIDVTEVTQLRLLVAVLFLAVYWLLAGPVGHLILRAYGVVHWSWWVFGGAVVMASGLAAAVVMLLHLTSYDLRHKTVVLGAVNSPDVTTLAYYGVFAPASGQLVVQQPPPPPAGV
jgi:hypothetical protein